MQDRVLDAPDIEVDGKPIGHGFRRKRHVLVFRIDIAIEVPRRVHESVHRVGLTPRRAAAFGTGRVHEVFVLAESRATLAGDRDVARENNGELGFRHRHHAALTAIDHWNRSPPVALAGDTPITNPVRNGRFAKTGIFRMCRHRRDGFLGRKSGELARVYDGPVIREGRFEGVVVGSVLSDWRRLDHRTDRQPVLLRESEVAFIMRRHRHDRTGAVIH